MGIPWWGLASMEWSQSLREFLPIVVIFVAIVGLGVAMVLVFRRPEEGQEGKDEEGERGLDSEIARIKKLQGR